MDIPMVIFSVALLVAPARCTPGMLMSAKALLDQNPDPTDDEIKTAIEGKLCRCGGYAQIIESIKVAAKKRPA